MTTITRTVTRDRVVAGLTILLSGFILYIGTVYLLDPLGTAATFGVPTWPHTESFLLVKGVRDVVSGLVLLTVLATGTYKVLGWVLLAMAVTPVGDMLIVLSSGGSTAMAFGVHGATALVVALSGLFVLRTSRSGR